MRLEVKQGYCLTSQQGQKVFPSEGYASYFKMNLYVLAKDTYMDHKNNEQVNLLMKGFKSIDVIIVATKADVWQDDRADCIAATSFLPGLVADTHPEPCWILEVDNEAGKRQLMSDMDSTNWRGNRGRAHCGGGRLG